MKDYELKQLILEVLSDVLENVHYYVEEGESFDKSTLKDAVDETRREYSREEADSL